jgi:hypothetical protein
MMSHLLVPTLAGKILPKVAEFELPNVTLPEAFNPLREVLCVVTSIVWEDFNDKTEFYDAVENSVKSSNVSIKVSKNDKGNLSVKFLSADIVVSFNDKEQFERFEDKEWSENFVIPVLKLYQAAHKETARYYTDHSEEFEHRHIYTFGMFY